jgi:hypothetical protein
VLVDMGLSLTEKTLLDDVAVSKGWLSEFLP